jgi:hypothetical protein
MNSPQPEWSDLKSDWQSLDVSHEEIARRLRWNLRLRIWGSRLWLAIEIGALLLLTALVVSNALQRQVGAAISLGLVVAVCTAAGVWARRSRRAADMRSLPQMIDYSITRARTGVRIAAATYFALIVMLVYALIIFYVPVQGVPGYQDVTWLAVTFAKLVVLGAITLLFHWFKRRHIRRFTELKRAYSAQE